jgi:endonuclease/exonuclease/phosphatase family metal-dependent hydrolase
MKRILGLLLLLVLFSACNRISVMTYNIHATRGMDKMYNAERIAQVIKAQKPDLVALQEVDQLTERSGFVDVLAVLKETTGMYGVFMKTFNYQGGEFGNAILSRYPILETRTIHLPSRSEYEPRIMMMISCVNEKGDTLHFYNTHLDHHVNNSDRPEQIQKIISTIQDDNRKIILAGDFNCEPGIEPLSLVEQVLARSDSDVKTYPSDKPDRLIDHIFFSEDRGISLCTIKVIEEVMASDHRPVIATFKIK